MVGIVSYGFYIPKYRIKTEEIAHTWNKNAQEIQRSLGVYEKAVAGIDEDSLTMAYESSSMALSKTNITGKDIRAIFFGSESPVYAVNPSSTILGELLGIEKNYLAYDTQFACKAATGAIISALSLIKSKYAQYTFVCASDKATGRPRDPLEYSAASGSVSLILGNQNIIAEILGYESFSSDTPDFWRRDGIRYPSHSGRFTGKPSYFFHIQQVTKLLLSQQGYKPSDFKYGVFHMPNGKFPLQVANSLGFTDKQIEPSLVVRNLGNSYTASALMGLVAVLEQAKKNDLIFLASYGSGAGSDAFIIKVNKNQNNKNKQFQKQLEQKKYINYATYLKYMNSI